jgi:hypothetical protein
MLTTQQADAVAAAILTRPSAVSNEACACPACSVRCIGLTQRARLGPFARLTCPCCGQSLQLRWGRSLGIGYVAAMTGIGIWIYLAWHSKNHVPALLPALISASFLIFMAALRRLPLVRTTPI